MPAKQQAKQQPKKPYVNWAKVPVLMRIDELAILVDGDEDTIRSLARDGEIPGAQKIGNRWLVERETFRRYFEGNYAPPRISDADAAIIASIVARELILAGVKA